MTLHNAVTTCTVPHIVPADITVSTSCHRVMKDTIATEMDTLGTNSPGTIPCHDRNGTAAVVVTMLLVVPKVIVPAIIVRAVIVWNANGLNMIAVQTCDQSVATRIGSIEVTADQASDGQAAKIEWVHADRAVAALRCQAPSVPRGRNEGTEWVRRHAGHAAKMIVGQNATFRETIAIETAVVMTDCPLHALR